MRAVLL
jgi:hypothetical protein